MAGAADQRVPQAIKNQVAVGQVRSACHRTTGAKSFLQLITLRKYLQTLRCTGRNIWIERTAAHVRQEGARILLTQLHFFFVAAPRFADGRIGTLADR